MEALMGQAIKLWHSISVAVSKWAFLKSFVVATSDGQRPAECRGILKNFSEAKPIVPAAAARIPMSKGIALASQRPRRFTRSPSVSGRVPSVLQILQRQGGHGRMVM